MTDLSAALVVEEGFEVFDWRGRGFDAGVAGSVGEFVGEGVGEEEGCSEALGG